MQFVSPLQEQLSVMRASLPKAPRAVTATEVTAQDVRQMILYLRKARDRAEAIRERAPAGSYMENVLARTIDGITLELSQLDYLLARTSAPKAQGASHSRAPGRMRPAI